MNLQAVELYPFIVVNVHALPLSCGPHRVVVQEAGISHCLCGVNFALKLHIDGVEESEVTPRPRDEDVSPTAIVALDVRPEGREFEVENLPPTGQVYCRLQGMNVVLGVVRAHRTRRDEAR